MSIRLYKANVLAACAYALASLFACSAYKLWLPHAVGYIAPAASVLVAGLWAFHCWQLGLMNGLERMRALRIASAPLVIAVVAGMACWIRYNQEYAHPG